jgi:hypothetical protein
MARMVDPSTEKPSADAGRGGKVAETTWTPEELETERQRGLRESSDPDARPAPGTFHCHEALHMTSFLTSAIDTELCNHPAILANPEWFRLAMEGQQKLADLYQDIGSEHLSADEPAGREAPSREKAE